ncbi:MAG: serine protease [Planctomycetes bacterium]|nr:serine protease [Planctomycetota bacterium]
MEFKQADKVRDFVFPLLSANKVQGKIEIQSFLGTAFLIGNRGYALTAAHVINNHGCELLVSMFVDENSRWCVFEINQSRVHPNQDVAIIKMSGGNWKSPFQMRNQWEGSSRKYQMFGYPDDVARELINYDTSTAMLRPDLVYVEGYIRRRLPFNPRYSR